MGVEVYITRGLVSKVVRHNQVMYILFKSGNELLYRTVDDRLVGNIEELKHKNILNTESILQNKYISSRNNFDLVRDQLLPKPNLR